MASSSLYDLVVQAADHIRSRTRYTPRIALVLGSGLSSLAERIGDPDVFPYLQIPHFSASTVAGHAGQLVIGMLEGVPVAIMQGRLHFYEGHSLTDVTLPVRVLRALGAEILLVTNAAGGLRPGFKPGNLMLITDHINLVGIGGNHPLFGVNDERLGPRFPEMSRAYDAELMAFAQAEAEEQNLSLEQGVYVMVAGPSFETPAEVRFLRLIGGDAVGMSTVPEVIVARHSGMRVLGISLISNVAIDSLDPSQPEPSHGEVLEAGQYAVPVLASLLEGIVRRLASSYKDAESC